MEPYQIKLAGLLGLAALGLAVTDTTPVENAAADQPSSAALGPAENKARLPTSQRQHDPLIDEPDRPDFDQLAAKAEAGNEMTAEERREFTRQVASRLEHPDANYSSDASSPD